MSRRVVVYLTIVGQRGVSPCVLAGCGAWGAGDTVEDARQRARTELRIAFGPGLRVKERVEYQEEGGE